jgi:hypothetical protein
VLNVMAMPSRLISAITAARTDRGGRPSFATATPGTLPAGSRRRPPGVRLGGLSLLLWSVLTPAVLGQGLVIEHRELGCVVADKFPLLTACIEPGSRVARARVYFRAERAPNWYYVELKSDTPCWGGVLPRPKRSLHQFSYYVAATDTTVAEVQTGEYTAEVVPDAAKCQKTTPAPFVGTASVAVSSAAGAAVAPEGFLAAGLAGAGLSSGLVLGVVGGGAAVVGGIAVIGGGGRGSVDNPGTAPAGGSPTTILPGTTPPLGTTTTTVVATPTTTLPGTPSTTLPGSTLPPSSCTGATTPPSVSITSPSGGPLPGLSALVQASASGTTGIANVEFLYQDVGHGSPVTIGAVKSPPYSIRWVFPTCAVTRDNTFQLTALATDTCGNVGTSAPVGVNLKGRGCFLGTVQPAPALAWTNELSAPGARGQVVLNGTEAFFPGPGPSQITAQGQPGDNRVEAVLVEGQGKRGTWRFAFGDASVIPGSLRAVAGEVEVVTPHMIVFRMGGLPGQRVVFTFATASSERVPPHE